MDVRARKGEKGEKVEGRKATQGARGNRAGSISNCFAFVTAAIFSAFSPGETSFFTEGEPRGGKGRAERKRGWLPRVLPAPEDRTSAHGGSWSGQVDTVTRGCFPVPGTAAERPVRMFCLLRPSLRTPRAASPGII